MLLGTNNSRVQLDRVLISRTGLRHSSYQSKDFVCARSERSWRRYNSSVISIIGNISRTSLIGIIVLGGLCLKCRRSRIGSLKSDDFLMGRTQLTAWAIGIWQEGNTFLAS